MTSPFYNRVMECLKQNIETFAEASRAMESAKTALFQSDRDRAIDRVQALLSGLEASNRIAWRLMVALGGGEQ